LNFGFKRKQKLQFSILLSAKIENTNFLNKKKVEADILSAVLLDKEVSCIKIKYRAIARYLSKPWIG